jgi:hypothetical protein
LATTFGERCRVRPWARARVSVVLPAATRPACTLQRVARAPLHVPPPPHPPPPTHPQVPTAPQRHGRERVWHARRVLQGL